MPLNQGQVLNNRYRIVRLLGQGGFGAVYRAWDVNLNQACAVKENLDTSPEASRQFAREATALARLSHPNLPRVTDHFTLPGQGQYLVMDYVEGDDLENLVRKDGPVPPEQALIWIDQVADALTYLHSHQPPVLHRDIKPANIRIRPDGRAMLVDFGLVKFYDPTMRTTMGARAITPGFSPPEQYGTGMTDTRTDIYALGATMYEILTGQEPPESVLRMSDAAVLVAASKINPNISPGMSQVIDKAMALTPSQRYQSAVEFKGGLAAAPMTKKVGSKPVKKQPSQPTVKAMSPTGAAPRRQPWLWILLLILFIGLAGVASLWIFDPMGVFGRRDTPTPESQVDADATEVRTPTETSLTLISPRVTPIPTRTLIPSPTLTLTQVNAGTFVLSTVTPSPTRTSTLTATSTRTNTPIPLPPSKTPTKTRRVGGGGGGATSTPPPPP